MKFELLRQFAEVNHIELSESQIDQFGLFSNMLIEKNKVMNLTAIVDPLQIEIKHLIDSIEGANMIKELAGDRFSLLDVGCGAGFPGIPLKILFPYNYFKLLDSSKKRIGFVNDVISNLRLEKVNAIASRAEDFKDRQMYDICTSRAVSSLNILSEYTLPFVKIGGYCVFYKSADPDEEIQEANAAIKELGGIYIKTEHFELPENAGSRSLVIVQKINETPSKYPRRAGKPSKSPIR